jgi:PAS domain-containing protein
MSPAMLDSWTVVFAGLFYVSLLFVVATWGDRLAKRRTAGVRGPLTYALSLGVYCTSWTYFGSVGLASRSGFDFLPLSRLSAMAFGRRCCGASSIWLTAQYHLDHDFIAAATASEGWALCPHRGDRRRLYLDPSARLAFSAELIARPKRVAAGGAGSPPLVAVAAAPLRSCSARAIDTTEHQHGSAGDRRQIDRQAICIRRGQRLRDVHFAGDQRGFANSCRRAWPSLFSQGSMAGMGDHDLAPCSPSFFCASSMSRSSRMPAADLRRAAWLFRSIWSPSFVIPIAVAGLLYLNKAPSTRYLRSHVPITGRARPWRSSPFSTTIGFDRHGHRPCRSVDNGVQTSLSPSWCAAAPARPSAQTWETIDLGAPLDDHRHPLLAYNYYRMIGSGAAPDRSISCSGGAVCLAFLIGLIWKRATSRGARWGSSPACDLGPSSAIFADAGWIPAGLSGWLPGMRRCARTLFYLEFDPLTHGVLWSLMTNLALVIFWRCQPSPISASRPTLSFPNLPAPAASGFRIGRAAVTVGQLESTVARYLGEERTDRAFAEHAAERALVFDKASGADIRTVRFAEHLLASAIGPASSRLVMALLLERHSTNARAAIKLLDDASAAIQYNRDLLQSAIDNVRQGIAVFDRDMDLICWNRQFRQLLSLPPEVGRLGAPLGEVVTAIIDNAGYEASLLDETVSDRLARDSRPQPFGSSRSGVVVEIDSSPLPDDGIVISCRHHRSVSSADLVAHKNARRRVEEPPAELRASMPSLPGARERADRPIAADSSSPQQVTSCSRSMRRGFSPQASSTDKVGPIRASWCATSMPRSRRSRISSTRCSIFPASMPAS